MSKTDQNILQSHTTGPWQAKKICCRDDHPWVILWPSENGAWMRRVDDKGQFTESDAKLIAAMPELLEAAIQVDALSIQSDAHKHLRAILQKLRADEN